MSTDVSFQSAILTLRSAVKKAKVHCGRKIVNQIRRYEKAHSEKKRKRIERYREILHTVRQLTTKDVIAFLLMKSDAKGNSTVGRFLTGASEIRLLADTRSEGLQRLSLLPVLKHAVEAFQKSYPGWEDVGPEAIDAALSAGGPDHGTDSEEKTSAAPAKLKKPSKSQVSAKARKNKKSSSTKAADSSTRKAVKTDVNTKASARGKAEVEQGVVRKLDLSANAASDESTGRTTRRKVAQAKTVDSDGFFLVPGAPRRVEQTTQSVDKKPQTKAPQSKTSSANSRLHKPQKRAVSPVPVADEPHEQLHPSWEAKKKLQEQLKARLGSGQAKKIKFDE